MSNTHTALISADLSLPLKHTPASSVTHTHCWRAIASLCLAWRRIGHIHLVWLHQTCLNAEKISKICRQVKVAPRRGGKMRVWWNIMGSFVKAFVTEIWNKL